MKAGHLAIVLSLLAILASALVAANIFEHIPHLEDEIAYVWQADVLAKGQLAIPSPPHPKSFLVPFVIDYHGLRFGKYPPGWPALLALGVRLGARWVVNPILAGLGIWLTYRLGRRVFNTRVGLLAAGLTLASPFFLMNSGSLLSHPFGLVLSLVFALCWLEAFAFPGSNRKWLAAMSAALALAVLFLTRPMTAIGVGLPFAIHGFALLIKSDRETRLRLALTGLIFIGAGILYLGWQYTLTGDPFLNPYTLWWPYDKVGFGPGYGVTPEGHSLNQAIINTRQTLSNGAGTLFGWGSLSWIFLPFGIWAARRNYKALLVSSVFPALVLVYMTYWIGAFLFGPRYYYEGFYSLSILSAAGISFLAGLPRVKPTNPPTDSFDPVNPAQNAFAQADASYLPKAGSRVSRLAINGQQLRLWLVGLLLVGLTAYNLFYFTPEQLAGMRGLYDIHRARLQPFLTPSAQALTPALLIVHPKIWMPYGNLLELEDPWLTTPFIFAISRGTQADAELAAEFPDRRVYHYYPEEPYTFYIFKQ